MPAETRLQSVNPLSVVFGWTSHPRAYVSTAVQIRPQASNLKQKDTMAPGLLRGLQVAADKPQA